VLFPRPTFRSLVVKEAQGYGDTKLSIRKGSRMFKSSEITLRLRGCFCGYPATFLASLERICRNFKNVQRKAELSGCTTWTITPESDGISRPHVLGVNMTRLNFSWLRNVCLLIGYRCYLLRGLELFCRPRGQFIEVCSVRSTRPAATIGMLLTVMPMQHRERIPCQTITDIVI
jgi:hypothetical protein